MKPELVMNVPKLKQFCSTSHSLLLTKKGELYVFGSNFKGQLGKGDTYSSNIPFLLMVDPDIDQISCGIMHSVMLKKNGFLKIFFTC